MSKEEILLAAVPLMIDVVTYALTFSGESFDRQSLFMTEFPAPVWEMLEIFSTGCTPDGTRVLEAPLKIIDMIS